MKVIITGCSGFVGKLLRSRLQNNGHEILGMDIASDKNSIVAVDMTDFSHVNKIMQDFMPDAIIHLAAISRVDFNDPRELYRINITGTINVLTASINLPVIPRFILASSSQVYGNAASSLQPISEDCAVKPVNHYGASKASCENISTVFHHEHGLPLVIARPFNHTGRGQALHFVIPKIIDAYKKHSKEIELGNIDVIRDFSDVRDVIEAYSILLDNFIDGGIFNIASGIGVSVREIMSILETMTGHEMKIMNTQSLLRGNEILQSIGNFGCLRSATGWQPRITFEETLEWMLTDDYL